MTAKMQRPKKGKSELAKMLESEDDRKRSLTRQEVPSSSITSLAHTTQFVLHDTATKFYRFAHNSTDLPVSLLISSFQLLRPALASNSFNFEPPSNVYTLEADQVADETGWFNLPAWSARGMKIRKADSIGHCVANLAYMLDNVGSVNAAEYSGAASALSLLPTAGALVSAPTKESWVLFQLLPLSGILSMFTSLGGSLTPNNVGDYDLNTPFTYGGMIATGSDPTLNRRNTDMPMDATKAFTLEETHEIRHKLTPAQQFAHKVAARACEHEDISSKLAVCSGIAIQCLLISCLLIVFWYAQRGAVIVWMCKLWGWMYLWYFLVVITSIADNVLAPPFVKNWKFRISTAPSNLEYDDSAVTVTRSGQGRFSGQSALDFLMRGVNTRNYPAQRLGMQQSARVSRECFYVIISLSGGTKWQRAMARAITKGSSVAVFAFGTALFASATLMSISTALMVLATALPIGIFGRITSLWIVSELKREGRPTPIVHTIVGDKESADEYVEEMLKIRGLMFELNGHIIINEKCVYRRRWGVLTSWATYLGLLASPFDIIKEARKSWPKDRRSTRMSFGTELGAYTTLSQYPPLNTTSYPSQNMSPYPPVHAGSRATSGSSLHYPVME